MIKVNIHLGSPKWLKKIKNPKNYFNKKFHKLNKILNKKKKIELSILLTDNQNMKKLNFKFRGKKKPTDVLSFPFDKKDYIGDIAISFEFVNFAKFKFKVIAIIQNESVYLEIVESEFGNVGHIMKYDLDENDGKTRVRYTYEGFDEMDDSYANMNYSSAKYLESLRQYCQTGKGEAFGSSSYRA